VADRKPRQKKTRSSPGESRKLARQGPEGKCALRRDKRRESCLWMEGRKRRGEKKKNRTGSKPNRKVPEMSHIREARKGEHRSPSLNAATKSAGYPFVREVRQGRVPSRGKQRPVKIPHPRREGPGSRRSSTQLNKRGDEWRHMGRDERGRQDPYKQERARLLRGDAGRRRRYGQDKRSICGIKRPGKT